MRCLRLLLTCAFLTVGCEEPRAEPTPSPPTVSAGGSEPGPRCEPPEPSADARTLRARLELLPDCPALRFALVERLVGAERCGEAEAQLDRLARAPETAEAGRIALVRLAAGECGTAQRRALVAPLCESLLAEPDAAASAWLACGRLAEANGETARAMSLYARAHERDPSELEALAAPAELALRFRDFREAGRLFGALTEAAPDRARGWRGLAEARHGSGDLAGAIDAMERAVTLDGSAPEPRYRLALWLRESGAVEPAVEQLRAFLVVAAGNPALEPAREEARATLDRWRRGL